MSRSFAQLARHAGKAKASILVEKEPLESPPLEIHTLGDNQLRKSAKRISKVDESVREVVRDMLRSMYTAKGIGLAAPQVGIQQQLLVIDIEHETPSTPPIVLINPEIITSSATVETYEEGCLSIPGVYLDVVRPASIKVSFRDEMGRPRKMNADGLLGRVIQHEMDHLKGVLFVDRVTDKDGLTKELDDHGFSAQHVTPISA